MGYIEKKIVSWEVKYGQILIPAKDYKVAKQLFKNYFKMRFNLETFKDNFRNRNFLVERNRLRLACKPFFSKLNSGDIIYIQPLNHNTIKISREKPNRESGILKILNMLIHLKRKLLMNLFK